MKISEAYNRYIEDYMIPKFRKQRQIDAYRVMSKWAIDYFGHNKTIESLSIQEVCAWLINIQKDRNICQNTMTIYASIIRQVLKYAKRQGIQCLDYELIPVPRRIPTTPTFLTPQEIRKLLNNTSGLRARLIIEMLYSSGLRVSELCSLNRDDIQNGQFTVIGKGNKERLCFIDKHTEETLTRYLSTRSDNNKALILTHLGTRLSPAAIQETIKYTSARAGITKRVTPHTLRHSFATNFLENNGNMRHLQVLLGHTNLTTTQIYAHVTNNRLKEVYLKHHSI